MVSVTVYAIKLLTHQTFTVYIIIYYLKLYCDLGIFEKQFIKLRF